MSETDLDDLRSKIDKIDANLCQLIKERQSLASKIMNAKKGGFPFDPKREEELIKKLVNLGLNRFLVEKVWRQIISSKFQPLAFKNCITGVDSPGSTTLVLFFGSFRII